jgi:excisionase family DNA binding protein
VTTPDPLVTLPASVVAQLQRLAARALVVEARSNGLDPQPGIGRLLTEVERARRAAQLQAEQPTAPASISVAEAARQMGCTPGWVRQLLLAGRLPGRRSGGVWLVDTPLTISPAAKDRTGTLAA